MTRQLPDHYEQLAAELHAAAARAEAAGLAAPGLARAEGAGAKDRARRRPWRRFGRRAPLLGLALVVAGTATAAVFTLTGEPSKPMTGQVLRGERSVTNYSVALTPYATVGTPGWCSSIVLRGPGKYDDVGGAGCGPAATVRNPLVSGGYTQSRTATIAVFVVSDQVAGMRLHGEPSRVILSRPDPSLPPGTRLLVTTLNELESRRMVGKDEPDFLDAAGHEIAQPGAHDRAELIPEQPVRQVDGLMPPGSPCRISFAGALPRGEVKSTVLRAPPQPTPELQSRPLLACGKTTIAKGPNFQARAEITVYVDAARPGDPPIDVPGRPAAPDGRVDGFTPSWRHQRRQGNAWVVVQSINEAEAARLFAAVTVEGLPG